MDDGGGRILNSFAGAPHEAVVALKPVKQFLLVLDGKEAVQITEHEPELDIRAFTGKHDFGTVDDGSRVGVVPDASGFQFNHNGLRRVFVVKCAELTRGAIQSRADECREALKIVGFRGGAEGAVGGVGGHLFYLCRGFFSRGLTADTGEGGGRWAGQAGQANRKVL